MKTTTARANRWLRNLSLYVGLSFAWFADSSEGALIHVFFAGGQSNATATWSNAIKAKLVTDPTYDNVVVVHVNHPGHWLQAWYTETGVNTDYMTDFFNATQTGVLETQLAAITSAGDTYVISGFFWFQGEGDTGSTAAADAYPSRFMAMLNQIKSDAGLDYNIPFTLAVIDAAPGYETELASISRTYANVDYLRNIQQAELAVAANNGTSVDTRGYARVDVWHLTAGAVGTVGTLMAQQHITTFGSSVIPPNPPTGNVDRTYTENFNGFTVGSVNGQKGWTSTTGTPQITDINGGNFALGGTSAGGSQGSTGTARNASLFELGKHTTKLTMNVRMRARLNVFNTLTFIDSSGSPILKFGVGDTSKTGFILGSADLGNLAGDNMLPGSGSTGSYAWYDVRLTVNFNGAGTATATLEVDKDGGSSENFETVVLNQNLGLATQYEDPSKWTGFESSFRFVDAQQDDYSLQALETPFTITEIKHDQNINTVTLTWNDTGADSYAVRLSRNLEDWSEVMAAGIHKNLDENPDDADHITVTFALDAGQKDEPHLFFCIQEE